MDNAKRRLQHIQTTIDGGTPQWRQVLVLPDQSKSSVVALPNGTTKVALDQRNVLNYRPISQTASLVLSGVGTSLEEVNHVPKYAVLELSSPDDRPISVPDLWACIYTLWTLLHTQEHIPVIFSPSESTPNSRDLVEYLLYSGLGRKRLGAQPFDNAVPEIFLVRATFWQGAGAGAQWGNNRGWLRGTYAARTAAFPATQSFTRTPLAIAAHPLRPPKPPRGACVYRRFCAPVGRTLAFHMVDPQSTAHMQAFHRWHNDPRVHSGWGESGTMERHLEYVQRQIEDPHVLPFMMSWDGELMGYAELVWIRENHVAAFIPEGPMDYDRGLHVLCGEDKFRGQAYSQAWFRSVTHYIFLADPRTFRVVGEPKRANAAIIKTSIDAGMHLQTSFDFPYKRSVMTMNLRERFFKEDMLT